MPGTFRGWESLKSFLINFLWRLCETGQGVSRTHRSEEKLTQTLHCLQVGLLGTRFRDSMAVTVEPSISACVTSERKHLGGVSVVWLPAADLWMVFEQNYFFYLHLIEIAVKTADFRFLMSFLNKKLIDLSRYLLTTSHRHDSTCQSSRQSLFPDREITGFVAPKEFFFTLRWKESSHCK